MNKFKQISIELKDGYLAIKSKKSNVVKFEEAVG